MSGPNAVLRRMDWRNPARSMEPDNLKSGSHGIALSASQSTPKTQDLLAIGTSVRQS
jgi:hypothetical protein